MSWIVTLSVCMLLIMAVAQFAGVWHLARHIARSRRANERLALELQGRPQPRAAVLLSLRGADPDLVDGLIALGQQSYSNYEVVVVIDHELDPSLDVARKAAAALPPGRLRYEVIKNRSVQCGLKCCALAQAYRSLDPQTEIIALVDADIVVHPDWLTQLATPLADPKVGVVTGAQWFEPQDGDIGTWMRSIWNAGASVPTIVLGHPWAGSCAMRRSDIDRMKLIEAWERSIIDDGPIAAMASQMKQEVRFVPDAWMINRENCSRKFLIPYLTRMLTWSRLYETTYPVTVGHALGTIAMWGIAWYTVLLGLVRGERGLVLLGLLPALAFWLAAVAGYGLVRQVLRPEVARRGIRLRSRNLLDLLRVMILVPPTYIVYAWSSVAALMVRRVLWRGVEYRLDNGAVRMTHYEPYRAAPPGTRSSVGTPRIALRTDGFARAGIVLFFLLISFQFALLTQMNWKPRYAAVVIPASLRHPSWMPEYGTDRGQGEATDTVPNNGSATNSNQNASQGDSNPNASDSTEPIGSQGNEVVEPFTSPETWQQLDAFASRIDAELAKVTDSEGVMVKQERIGGKLEPLTTIAFRQLTSPLCIYLRWTDVGKGREVLFRTEGPEQEVMIARQETLLGALVPTVSLSKDHAITRTVSNHPVDELSSVYLRSQLKRYLAHARRNPQAIIELVDDVSVGERVCQRLTIVHPAHSELAPRNYHRVDMYFESGTGFPVRWEKYHWPDWKGEDQNETPSESLSPPLIEYFEVIELRINRDRTTEDFRNDHPDFGFGRAPLIPLE